MFGIFFFMSLISATNIGTFEQNTCAKLYQMCDNCPTGVNVTSVKPPFTDLVILNEPMNNSGVDFTYDYCNISQVGGYHYNVCGFKGATKECEVFEFDVTTDGNQLSIADSIVRIFLIIFFVSLLVGTHTIANRTDFEKWHNSIIKKYHTKNFVKMVLSALLYNTMKHTFMIYYLIGLPIIMIAQNLTYAYNITSLIAFMNVLLFIYTIGILIVGLVFLSYVQEWIVNAIELIKDMDWGIHHPAK